MYLDMDINWIWGWLTLEMSLLQGACICRVTFLKNRPFCIEWGVVQLL